MCRKGWSDLPPDLLREIAGRLQVAADFVIFHAICKSWRSSPDLLSGKHLLPWRLAPTEKSGGQSSPLKLRCVFSKSSYRVLPPPSYPRGTSWDPRGIVYGDGTVFLFGLSRVVSPVTYGDRYRFRAALLRPGEAEWTLVTLVDVNSGIIRWQGEFCAAYHGGRILVTTESNFSVVTPDSGTDLLVAAPWVRRTYDYRDRPSCIYIIESHGELLCVSVKVHGDRTFVLSVHALEEATSAPQKEMKWVRRKRRRLVDRVFFLGSPNSFAVDASLLCGHGGYAYFVYNDSNPENSGVFRYNLVDDKTEFVEPLPQDWDNHKCTWLVLKPIIASIEACSLPQIDYFH
ncbi:unnamed protein product [Alopecurus aequalis]